MEEDNLGDNHKFLYEKIEEVGSGTYGVVHKGRNKKTNEIIAIKKIKIELESEGIPSTALREICILKELSHPNIVEMKDIICTEKKLYIIFEYLEYDLRKYFEKTEQLNIDVIKSFLFQLLNGIAYCHSKKIIHRDLKPQNLLIDNQNNLKIADFGLARSYSIPIRPYTKEVLTLWYRAPEILLGCSEYNTSVDIWSIGCIFAELYLKKPLFQGEYDIDQLFKIFKILGTPDKEVWPEVKNLPHFKDTFPKWNSCKFEDLIPNIDTSASNLLEKMLHYDPIKRINAKQALLHPYFKTK